MTAKVLSILIFLVLNGFVSVFGNNNHTNSPIEEDPRDKPEKKYAIYKESKWVDSVFESMSLEDKIGQLFMISAYTSKDKSNINTVKKLVQKYKVGGVIFFKGGPMRTALAINQIQSVAKYPVMMAIDGEWGISMRLDSTINYGYQMAWGANQYDSIHFFTGRRIAQECKRIGIHVNFAPVVDVNNNPLNPVINLRSFGESKKDVSRKSILFMQGMQKENILAVAKHFPGHGNTDADSHYELPVLKQTAKNLDTLELYPFKEIFKEGIGAVMTGHLNIPAYDSALHSASSLSPAVTTTLLRWQMKFKGIAFSDALNMQGVAKYNLPGETEYKALLAGNDILLCPEDVPRAIELIKSGIC